MVGIFGALAAVGAVCGNINNIVSCAKTAVGFFNRMTGGKGGGGGIEKKINYI